MAINFNKRHRIYINKTYYYKCSNSTTVFSRSLIHLIALNQEPLISQQLPTTVLDPSSQKASNFKTVHLTAVLMMAASQTTPKQCGMRQSNIFNLLSDNSLTKPKASMINHCSPVSTTHRIVVKRVWNKWSSRTPT